MKIGRANFGNLCMFELVCVQLLCLLRPSVLLDEKDFVLTIRSWY